MTPSFNTKTIVITGAGSGIGRALALACAKEGAKLALVDVNAENLAAVVEEANSVGAPACYSQALDVRDENAVDVFADTVQKQLGSADIIFNNAGIARIGRFEVTQRDDFKSVMDVNFWGPVNVSRAFLEQLKLRQGILVNISSLFGLIGVPRQTAYCASKFAVRGFSESLRQELSGTGVQVCSVHPGGIDTNIAKSAGFDEFQDKREEMLKRMHEKGLVMPPSKAAEIIIKGTKKRKPRILVGNDAKLISAVQRLMPTLYPVVMNMVSPTPKQANENTTGISEHPARPSLRSRAFSLFLKNTTKKLLSKGNVDLDKLRSQLNARASKKMPANINISNVDDNGVRGEWQIPAGVNTGRTILYLHGGGYSFCSPATHRNMTCKLAQCSVAQLFSLDYRLAPEAPYPAAVDDAVAAYRWLLDQGISAQRLVVAGDSAGGGLTLALLLKLKELGLEQPAGAMLLSPWTDLSISGASVQGNVESCAMFTGSVMHEGAAHYVGSNSTTDPLISPLFADLSGLPPLLTYASNSELLLDDTLRLHERAHAQGVSIQTRIWKNQAHVWPAFYPLLPEAAETLAEMGNFVSQQTTISKAKSQAA